ncbi:MAG: SAF domain-containing protein [Eubacteriales bacterium]|nr:SAF domain-containing protein [Eubacteriales bacterium]
MKIPDFKLNFDTEEIKFKIEELKKNRITLGALSIIIALIICFVITPIFTSALRNRVNIVKASKDIQKGQMITEDMVEVINVGGYNLPKNIIEKKEDIINSYAEIDIKKDTYCLKTMFNKNGVLKNETLNDLNGFNRAISFTVLDLARGLSAKIEKGDIISIISKDTDNNSIIHEELQYLLVLNTTTEYGTEYDAQDISKTEETKILAKTYTVLCSQEQALIISTLERENNTHVILVYRGDEAKRKIFLDLQDEILEEKYKDKRATISEVQKEKLRKKLEGKEENNEIFNLLNSMTLFPNKLDYDYDISNDYFNILREQTIIATRNNVRTKEKATKSEVETPSNATESEIKEMQITEETYNGIMRIIQESKEAEEKKSKVITMPGPGEKK